MIIPGHPTPFVAGSKVLPPEPRPFTTAWRLPSTFQDVNAVWTNEPNAFVENDLSARLFDNRPGGRTESSDCYFEGYGFSTADFPANAVISGIEMQVKFVSTGALADTVRMWLYTGVGSVWKSQAIVQNTTYTFAFGGATDLWGLSPAPGPGDLYGGALGVNLQFISAQPDFHSGNLMYAKIRIHGEGVFA
jgi:hypothetical protein